MKAYTKTILVIVILFSGCKKHKTENICDGIKQPSGKFVTKEVLRDTAFTADTIFRNNYVQFLSLDNYESVNWKLGNDPRDWLSQDFSLSFFTALGSVPINFTGKNTPNNQCFPQDNGIYASSQKITLVEQVERPILTVSPLVGRYSGYFTNAPADTFIIRIDYFDSSKYDIAVTGSRNFYWISNIPKGFISTLGWSYPELKYGQSIYMGYKCFQFGTSDNIIQGKGWLSKDTLYINYGSDIVGRKKFIGKKL